MLFSIVCRGERSETSRLPCAVPNCYEILFYSGDVHAHEPPGATSLATAVLLKRALVAFWKRGSSYTSKGLAATAPKPGDVGALADSESDGWSGGFPIEFRGVIRYFEVATLYFILTVVVIVMPSASLAVVSPPNTLLGGGGVPTLAVIIDNSQVLITYLFSKLLCFMGGIGRFRQLEVAVHPPFRLLKRCALPRYVFLYAQFGCAPDIPALGILQVS